MDAEEYIGRVRRLSQEFLDGKYDKIIKEAPELCNARPERVGAYLVLAQTLLRKGDAEEASQILEKAASHCPDPAIEINLAIIYVKLEKIKEADKLFTKIQSSGIKVSNPKYWFNYARNSVRLGKFKEAIRLYQKCLKLKPDHKAALNNLANIYQKREDFKKAEEYYKILLSHYPQEGMGYSNLAGLYERKKETNSAIEYYEKAIKIEPTLSIAYYNLGQLLANEKGDHLGALKIFEEGLKRGDGTYQSGIRLYQIIARQHLVDWTHYEEDVADLNKIIEEYLHSENPIFEIVPYALSYSKVEPNLYTKVAEKYASKIQKNISQQFPNISYDHSISENKIKIGYYSPNFRQHPGGTLVRELFDYHDNSRFEIHAFSLVHTDDFINKEIRDSVDYYHDVSSFTSLEIANLINRTGIDILVALAGYNSSMKFDVLALRPAPIQMVMVGSHETTGADFVDYVFSDEFMLDDQLRQNFHESVISLPCSLLVNSSFPLDKTISTNRSDHNLPEKVFVFANFNHPKKLDPDTFDAWMKILQNVPKSVLWLYGAGQDSLAKTLTERSLGYQIEPERLIFAKPLSIHQHWERLKHADLFLDNFTYNAHVTGIEALRMGVPMVTLKGHNHNSRLSSSLLKYCGLEKFISLTKNDYITLSSQLATRAAELGEVREKLQRADNVMLFDTELQVRYLEKAYLKALLKFKKGLVPQDFEVGSALDLNSFRSD
ncbi:tetratricopeptide repeat protein [Ekhidna sp.]|uniref:tetratricopeptide repeat protein n=1 Tax=Ekhidna sp. TaxID=2608089 RepID=UPI0035191652